MINTIDRIWRGQAQRDAALHIARGVLGGLLVMAIILGSIGPSRAQNETANIDELLARLTLEEKVGQLFVVRFWGQSANANFARLYEAMRPGGLVLMRDNIQSPEQVRALTVGLQGVTGGDSPGIPLFIMADQESRKIQRLREGFAPLASTYAVGAVDRNYAPEAVAEYGAMMGADLRAVGVNMNLAPLADLALRPDNPVMAGRMLGDDPSRVNAHVRALARGMAAAGVVAVVKHFPGHGAVDDTHTGTAALDFPLEVLQQRELAAFPVMPPAPDNADLTHGERPAVMLGHFAVPAIDPSGLPASLSPAVVAYFRQNHGPNTLLMTDALDMGAIVTQYSIPEAATRAVEAGVDLLLLGAYTSPEVQIEAYNAVLEAVRSGRISEAHITESARRILEYKAAYAILNSPGVDGLPAPVPDRAAADETLFNLYRAAVTVVKNEGAVLPLVREGGPSFALIAQSYYAGIIADACDVDVTPISYAPTLADRDRALSLARLRDVVVVFTENADWIADQQDFVRALPPEKTVVVALGSPFDLNEFPRVAGYMLAYDSLAPALRAVCPALFGEAPTAGILPVTLIADYPSGISINVGPAWR